MAKLWRMALVLAVVAVCALRVNGDEYDDDDDEDVAKQSGPGPQFREQQGEMTEEMQKQQQQQMQVIQFIMQTVSQPCKEELQTLMSRPPEEQQGAEISEECRAEIQTAVATLQQQQGGQAGGPAPGGRRRAGAESAGTPPPPPRESALPIIAQVLFALVAGLGAIGVYVYYANIKREQYLKEHPEVLRKLMERGKGKKRGKGVNTSDE